MPIVIILAKLYRYFNRIFKSSEIIQNLSSSFRSPRSPRSSIERLRQISFQSPVHQGILSKIKQNRFCVRPAYPP